MGHGVGRVARLAVMSYLCRSVDHPQGAWLGAEPRGSIQARQTVSGKHLLFRHRRPEAEPPQGEGGTQSPPGRRAPVVWSGATGHGEVPWGWGFSS